MATFKVGQRVKVVSISHNGPGTQVRVGMIGTITEATREMTLGQFLAEWIVRLDELGPDWSFASYHLAPLTDPGAEKFIERVKSWKPEPAAIPLPVKAPLTGSTEK